MAKGKRKPTSKPQVKKVEPNPKKVEAKIEKVIETSVVEEPIVKVKVPKIKEKESKHEFPTEENCKHTKTKRAIGRNSRATTVCVECGTVTRFGAR